MKIVVLDGYQVNHDNLPWQVKAKYPDLTWHNTSEKHEIIERIGDAEAVFVNRAPLWAEVFENCKNLKYIGVLGTGYNAIDTAAAKDHGIVVTNVSGYSTAAVTQTVFSLLLEIMGSISARTGYVKAGGWQKFADPNISAVPMNELYGKTLGIVGYGTIGKSVATVAAAFGMNVLANKRTPDKSLETEHFKFASLEEIYSEADVISIHCPLTDATKGMINAESIAQMKDGVIILNTARGPVLDEQAVSDALDSGKIYMLGADVLSSEPPEPNNPLVKNPRALITPHVGWTPKETRVRLLELSAKNFFAFVEGNPINVVNP